MTHNVLRYHQIGVAEGWVEVEGQRTTIDPTQWISVRDHSWGLRPGVGLPIPGLPWWLDRRRPCSRGSPYRWNDLTARPTRLFSFHQHSAGEGFTNTRSQAELQELNRSPSFVAVRQDLRFDEKTRRLTGGTVTLVDTDRSTRPLRVSPVGPTGFHLGTSGYFGWNGRVLGQWAGDLVVDGEHLTGLDQPDVARSVHQLRDLLVRVEDPVGGGTGLGGNIETLAVGAFPELGLSAESSFL